MRILILSHYNVILFHLLWSLSCLYSVSVVQDMTQTTWDTDYLLKYIEEQANQQLEKIRICGQANITNLYFVPEDNVIKVIFKLRDEKFQDCFKYFKISVEKKRRVIKEVTIRYLHERQKAVSHRFENISCGVYKVFVQPCYNDRSCPLFRWTYAKSINVTSKDCIGYSLNKNISDEKTNEKIIIISSITALIFLTAIYELISYCYLSGKQKLKKVGDKTNVLEHGYVKIATNEDLKTEIKSIHIYIFHSYDEGNIIKGKVETLKDHLILLLKYLFDAAIQGGLKSSLYSSIKTIDSELPKILFNVNNWLKDALNEKVEDGCLRKIIWIGSEMEEENEDSLENLIFSEFKDKIRNNARRCLYGYDNLFVVRLHGIHTFSSELENIVSGSRYYIPTSLVDLCLDLCSGSGLFSSEDKEKLKILLQQHLAEHLGAFQDI